MLLSILSATFFTKFKYVGDDVDLLEDDNEGEYVNDELDDDDEDDDEYDKLLFALFKSILLLIDAVCCCCGWMGVDDSALALTLLELTTFDFLRCLGPIF